MVTASSTSPCSRCGIQFHRSKTSLCPDCNLVLSRLERKVWAS